MFLQNLNVLRGPNYWSTKQHQLIVMLIDETADQSPESIPGFIDRYNQVLGNVQFSADRFSNLAEVIEYTTVELQKQAGIETVFHKTIRNHHGYQVVFSYSTEPAGVCVAESACKMVNAILNGDKFDLSSTIKRITELEESNHPGPSTFSIYAEALKRGIPALRLDQGSYFQLGYGAAQKRFEATITSQTNTIAVDKAGNKDVTKQLLTDACIPVPKGCVINHVENLGSVLTQLGYPVVIKPLDGNQGKGATINIRSATDAEKAFALAKTFSDKVVVEQYIKGNDFRALVIDNKFVAAAKRIPACITGDGIHTIRELVAFVNADPRRGNGHSNALTKIHMDEQALQLLATKNYDADTIPDAGEIVNLKSTANLSTGGTAEDVTEMVHPSNVLLFERISRIIGLDICGIDIQAQSLASPITENGGAIIEVNAAPGFRMHLQPSKGQPRNVAAPVIDMLFPHSDGRIPIVAITGTNGKTTTTRLIAKMVQQHGYSTGFTTTDGIYLNGMRIHKGDCSGPASAKIILKDPAVEFAVLECARGGILRSGLGFDQCSCAVITNVAEDHLGLGGIDTIEQLAAVKSVVAKSVMPSGYAVLNADDDRVYEMKTGLSCNVALFSLLPDNPLIERHCANGGIAAVYEEGYLMIRKGNHLIPVEAVENIPVTHNGLAGFNIANALGAVLAAYVSGISLPAVRCTLRSFRNSSEDTPGRLNEFSFHHCKVMVDYAHNTHGIKALGEFIRNYPASPRIGIITAVGDRRNEDIISFGESAAEIFDEIIIRYDEDLRGRTELEIGSLLRSGILQKDPSKKIHHSANEIEAVEFALKMAPHNSLVVLLVEHAEAVAEKLKEWQQGYSVKEIRMAV
jgi:cyanophycin synthetase